MSAPAAPRPDYSTRSAAIRETARRCGLSDELIELAVQKGEEIGRQQHVDALRAEAKRLDDAYTEAIRDASQTGNWFGVPAYAHAAQQARAALKAQEGQQ